MFLPILFIYVTVVTSWLRGMSNSSNQVTTILSLPVDFFNSSITSLFSLQIGSITETGEGPLRRTGLGTGYHSPAFRDAVRARDQRCVITGREARLTRYDDWRSFEACHIFPLAYEPQWIHNNFGQWITIPPARESDGSINSVQNGILLGGTIHDLFDHYHLTINPDV